MIEIIYWKPTSEARFQALNDSDRGNLVSQGHVALKLYSNTNALIAYLSFWGGNPNCGCGFLNRENSHFHNPAADETIYEEYIANGQIEKKVSVLKNIDAQAVKKESDLIVYRAPSWTFQCNCSDLVLRALRKGIVNYNSIIHAPSYGNRSIFFSSLILAVPLLQRIFFSIASSDDEYEPRKVITSKIINFIYNLNFTLNCFKKDAGKEYLGEFIFKLLSSLECSSLSGILSYYPMYRKSHYKSTLPSSTCKRIAFMDAGKTMGTAFFITFSALYSDRYSKAYYNAVVKILLRIGTPYASLQFIMTKALLILSSPIAKMLGIKLSDNHFISSLISITLCLAPILVSLSYSTFKSGYDALSTPNQVYKITEKLMSNENSAAEPVELSLKSYYLIFASVILAITAADRFSPQNIKKPVSVASSLVSGAGTYFFLKSKTNPPEDSRQSVDSVNTHEHTR